MIPLLVWPFALYLIVISLAGANLSTVVFAISMSSGALVAVSLGDLFLLVSLFVLAAEVWRGISAGNRQLLNNLFSAALAIVAAGFLFLLQSCGNSIFLLLVVMMTIDAVVGTAITTIVGRKNIWVEQR
jgi:hypothetical protein